MKTRAVIEVAAVFCLTMLLVALVSLSPVGKRQRQATIAPSSNTQ